MDHKERQKLVEQRAMNAQTVQFVAEQQEEMAELALEQAHKAPGWVAVAQAERARAETLMEVAQEESRLATAIAMGTEPEGAVAADERELRKDLLEIARAESSLIQDVLALSAEDDATMIALQEQAGRNCDLLRHVAQTATEADLHLHFDSPEK